MRALRLCAVPVLVGALLWPLAGAAEGRRIVCLGDSVTNQYGPRFETADGEGCTVVAQDGASTPAVLDLFRSRVRGHGYTDIIVRAGRNDVYSGRSLTSAQDNLRTIYEEARADGMRVVAVSMLPHKGYARYSDRTQAGTDALNAWLAGAPADVFVNADAHLGDPADPQRLKPEYDGGDHLHLSPDGRCALASFIAERAFGGSGGCSPSGRSSPTSTGTDGGISLEETDTPFEQIVPTLQLPIPTFPGFSDIQVLQDGENRSIDIPFLAEYVVALYRYAIGIMVTIAMVMVVVGGFQWTTARGNASAIQEAKDRITNAIMGIVLALGSYAILAAINPELVNFRNIRIDLIRRREVIYRENGGIEEGCRGGSCGSRRPIANTDFDEMFQRYAGCAGVDWRMLKAVAYIESGLNPEIVNRYGFVGLFQVAPRFCHLSRQTCTEEALLDPEINTFVAATQHLRNGARIVRDTCPSITDAHTFATLMYYAHNSGAGALRAVLNPRPSRYLPEGGAGCTNDLELLTRTAATFQRNFRPDIPNAEGRMTVARRVGDRARELGVTDPLVDGSCPSEPAPGSGS